jgi:hypothetical protein
MGAGPLPKPTRAGVGWFLFVCAAVLAAAVALAVAIGVFVPWQLLVAAAAVGVVFASTAIVSHAFGSRHAVFRAVTTSGIRLIAVTIIAMITTGLTERWLFVAMGGLLIAVTQLGTDGVNLYRRRTLSRLTRARGVTLLEYGKRSLFGSTLESRSIAYYGLLAGFGIGLVLMRSGTFALRNRLALPLLCALIGTALVLLFEIIRNGVLMADPLFDSAIMEKATLLSGRVQPILQINEASGSDQLSDEQIQEVAVAIADLRKTVFWSSVFATAVFFALALLILQVAGPKAPTQQLFIPTLVLLFLLIQVPYVWGQVLLHSNLLDMREGVARAELQEKLQKLSPLLPRVPALVALTTTGTAGGVLYLILSKMFAHVLDLK